MSYQWLRFLHIVTGLAFVGLHGASIVVLHAIRGETDRGRIEAALDLSGRTANVMYVTLGGVVGTGLWMGFARGELFSEQWYWLSLGLLVLIGVLMWLVAKPFTARIRTALEIRPSGIPRVSDAELSEILRSSTPNRVAAIGGFGLLAIVYLMTFQPVLVASEGDGTPPDEEVLQLGEELFQRSAGGIGCAACHGRTGGGTDVAPAITRASQAEIARALRTVPEMAAVRLDDAGVEAVYRYLQTVPGP